MTQRSGHSSQTSGNPYAGLTEIGEPSDDVQRVSELIVDDLRNIIVDLLSSGSECSSRISRGSRHTRELPTDNAIHAFIQEQKNRRKKKPLCITTENWQKLESSTRALSVQWGTLENHPHTRDKTCHL